MRSSLRLIASRLEGLSAFRGFGAFDSISTRCYASSSNDEGPDAPSTKPANPLTKKLLQQNQPSKPRESINPFDFVLGLYMGDTRFRMLTNGSPESTQRLLRILSSIAPGDLRNPLEDRMRAERAELLTLMGARAEDEGQEAGKKPVIYHRTLSNGRTVPYSVGLGRRKTARARVAVSPAGSLEAPSAQRFGGPDYGIVVINGFSFDHAFPLTDQREHVLRPLLVTGTVGRLDIDCKVTGGGPIGQAQAVAMAIAQALKDYEPSFRTVLDHVGLLQPDPRRRERKKPGRLAARTKPQWSKR